MTWRKWLLWLIAVAIIMTLSACTSRSGGSAGGAAGGSGTVNPSARLAKRNAAKVEQSAPEPDQDRIVIGVYADLTGDNSTFGEETRNGVTLAVEEVNRAGGVLGKQVVVRFEDTRSDPQQARNVVTKLIQQERVLAVIGEVASTMSLAGGPICQQYGVPMISPSSTNPAVTDQGNYIFRVCFTDPFQSYVMAKFLAEHLKVKRVAILYDNSSDYSKGLAEFFQESFRKMGGEITDVLSYKPQDTDFRSQLTTIRAKNPDAIYIPGYYKSVGLIARQARELGIKVPLAGGDGWSSPKLVEGAGGPGKAIEGCYFSDHYAPDDPAPQIQEFVKKYRQRFGQTPGGLAALAYDAARVLFAAIEKAGKLDRAAIRNAIANTRNFPGVTGVITINEFGDADKSAVVLQVRGNRFVFVTRITPETATTAASARQVK
ncbi:MAG: ABC transporter substrate-binding protein [Fimbriimonadales bacterium]|nr:ABC transporter substrate-binding protein [Armatimonadota bacterium]MCX7687624.1 ABC transporter substrate-binding protein [Fimbriimonadales bacterium]GBC89339.1 Leu/Ile/Val-binding protein [bacterium HR14]CUU35626.1 amino acid/amide ABC transporter substrate-binding protein, HAAT family [Armatimonadetes bacterium DC]